MTNSTQNQFLTTAGGIPRTWETMTGGQVSGEQVKYRNGGSIKEEVVGTPPTWSDIVLTRGFDIADLEMLRKLAKNCNKTRHTITKQPLDANMIRKGKPLVYPYCLLKGVDFPDTNSNSTSDRGMVTLTFATNGLA
ncbi:hypothetical protein [Glutamicibacter sp. TV12E]|uniref:hypothetical protein n=1 Tax=Glutamicibacter sp. TV12E TaxID=3446362 RepID=UPI004034CF55